jgi:hypothetical protein
MLFLSQNYPCIPDCKFGQQSGGYCGFLWHLGAPSERCMAIPASETKTMAQCVEDAVGVAQVKGHDVAFSPCLCHSREFRNGFVLTREKFLFSGSAGT